MEPDGAADLQVSPGLSHLNRHRGRRVELGESLDRGMAVQGDGEPEPLRGERTEARHSLVIRPGFVQVEVPPALRSPSIHGGPGQRFSRSLLDDLYLGPQPPHQPNWSLSGESGGEGRKREPGLAVTGGADDQLAFQVEDKRRKLKAPVGIDGGSGHEEMLRGRTPEVVGP
ncbi:MAG: hypothetical protein ACYTDY_13600 [Planctomycetota bacterium]